VTREEYNQVLATKPCTLRQLGAVMRECGRLGFRPGDRAGRLTACARLLGLGKLGSTRDLPMGEAGRLLRALQGFTSRAALDAAIAPPPPRPSWRDQIVRAYALADRPGFPWPGAHWRA
jgi:hypothetical protein